MTDIVDKYLSDKGIDSIFTYANRTLCDCYHEMRENIKVSLELLQDMQPKSLEIRALERNYKILASLIEEGQTLANRMEASLDYQKDLRMLIERRGELKKEIRDLRAELKDLIIERNNGEQAEV